MSGVHPKFDANSSCLNCAAFLRSSTAEVGFETGTCHRHAPRPFQAFTSRDVDGETTTDEQSDGPRFPEMSSLIFGKTMFCCEWLPGDPRTFVDLPGEES